MKFGSAQPVSPRVEDRALLTGQGRYTDDLQIEGQVHAAFARAQFAHARILSIDTSSAEAMPGVLGVFTGARLREAGLGAIETFVRMPGRSGEPMFAPGIPVLALERVRYVGEPVAMVVADTALQALDAAEAVLVEYDELPAAASIERALAPEAPVLWDGAPGNVALDWGHGDTGAVESAMARAAHIVQVRLLDPPVAPTALEPRAAIATWEDERYTLIAPTQGVSVVRKALAESVFRVPPEHVRVLTRDVGGGFGMKVQTYAEYAAMLHAARELGRPVRWCATRLESFLTDTRGRDAVLEGELAIDDRGKFLALRARSTVGVGAYVSAYAAVIATNNTKNCLSSVYAIPAIDIGVRMILTNASPLGPYRGAGRPEAIYLVERLIDVAARQTGIDRVELRRRNLIPRSAMPYAAPSGQCYDSGEFDAVLDEALALSDWNGFARRRSASEQRGMLRGIGLCCFLEVAGGSPLSETADLRFGRDGGIELRTGAQSFGQGQPTTIPMILARLLGVDSRSIRLVQGDSDVVPEGIATVASRSTVMVGGAMSLAVEQAIEKGREFAAEFLEASPSDLEYAAGRFRIAGTDRSVDIGTLVGQGFSLDTVAQFSPPEMSFPNGCHVCEVEIDPETGVVRVVGYTAVDDVGVIVHPVIVEGQVHGGVAQGLGQVLGEHLAYSDEGQLLTASLMDYPVLRAAEMPRMRLGHHEVACTTNPLGAKGAGESGVAGALPACVNAILDALGTRGVVHLDMPMTPPRVWEALQDLSRPRAPAPPQSGA